VLSDSSFGGLVWATGQAEKGRGAVVCLRLKSSRQTKNNPGPILFGFGSVQIAMWRSSASQQSSRQFKSVSRSVGQCSQQDTSSLFLCFWRWPSCLHFQAVCRVTSRRYDQAASLLVEPARRAGGCTKLGASRRLGDDHGNDRILKHKRNLQQSTILHRISGVKHAFSCLPAVEQGDSQTEKEGAESEVSLLRKAKKVGLLTRQVVFSGLGTAKESEVSWACGRGEIGDFPPFLPSCCRVLCPAPCTAVQTDRESRPPTSKGRVSNLSFFFGPHHKHQKVGEVQCGAVPRTRSACRGWHRTQA
jgi:hypothetical protein